MHKKIKIAELNLKDNKKEWAAVHAYEKKYKKLYLIKLSERSGFKLFNDLHKISYELGIDPRFNILDIDKIETLSRVHSIFGRVKE